MQLTHRYKTLPILVVFQLAYNHAYFQHICLMFLHRTCVNVQVGVRHHLLDTDVAQAIRCCRLGSLNEMLQPSVSAIHLLECRFSMIKLLPTHWWIR